MRVRVPPPAPVAAPRARAPRSFAAPRLPHPPATSPHAPTIHLIGIPTDINSSFLRGPAGAPAAIRAAIAACPGPLIALSGDHAISFPVVETLPVAPAASTYCISMPTPILYDELDGNRRSHASPFARIMEGGHARRLVQVGIRTLNRHCRAQAARFGVEIIEARHFNDAWRPRFDRPLYVSIDIDALDPAYAPGVSHHEPGGLNVRQIVNILADLDGPIIGGDVVELNPDRDPTGITATVAAKLVRELAAAIAA